MGAFPPNYTLAQLRADRGLSVRATGSLTGLSFQEVSLLTRGLADPKLTTILKLSRGLSIDPAAMQAILMATAEACEDGGRGMTAPELDSEVIADWSRASRADSGLGEKIEDRAVLAKVVSLTQPLAPAPVRSSGGTGGAAVEARRRRGGPAATPTPTAPQQSSTTKTGAIVAENHDRLGRRP